MTPSSRASSVTRRKRTSMSARSTTHNQRGRGTLYVGTEQRINAETLVRIVEDSMSSPIAALLKRPDELFVVEHAHLRPRFVEDSVRAALAATLERFGVLEDGDFLLSRQVNLETIHDHDVIAERHGTAGDARRAGDRRAAAAAHDARGLAGRAISPAVTQRPPRTRPTRGAGRARATRGAWSSSTTITTRSRAWRSHWPARSPGSATSAASKLADRIHETGSAVVWSGHREAAEHYWSQLHGHGLTMALLDR